MRSDLPPANKRFINKEDLLKKILINSDPWQTRVAVIDGVRLRDLALGTPEKPELERSFFKGRILKVLPGIQTAFVDIGQARSGFLHVTEVDRAMASDRIFESQDSGDEKPTKKEVVEAMDIGKIFTEGDSVLVQVTKEPVFEKGAKLTTCFTLPGKFVVLMPNIGQMGISKKIEDRDERSRLREIVENYLTEGMGAIVRTTAEGRPAKDIERDLKLLISTWTTISKKFARAEPGEKVYQDVPVDLCMVREHLDDETELVLCDNQSTVDATRDFVKQFMPEHVSKVRLYEGDNLLFEEFGIENQIIELTSRKVHLKSGGTLIIESTEAMTVVDVNTGRFVGKTNQEETIFKTNLEAAEEVVRQLRLRNIGGLIVIDFIDMRHVSNRQKLSRLLEKTLKEKDKLQSVALKVSEFGIVQMTRKRTGRTLVQQIMTDCQTCLGNAFVKSIATKAYELLRDLNNELIKREFSGAIEVSVPPDLFDYLKTETYTSILAVEKRFKVKIVLIRAEDLAGSSYRVCPVS
jgi:ribonuclease G